MKAEIIVCEWNEVSSKFENQLKASLGEFGIHFGDIECELGMVPYSSKNVFYMANRQATNEELETLKKQIRS